MGGAAEGAASCVCATGIASSTGRMPLRPRCPSERHRGRAVNLPSAPPSGDPSRQYLPALGWTRTPVQAAVLFAIHLWKWWVGSSMTPENTPPRKAGERRPRCMPSTTP